MGKVDSQPAESVRQQVRTEPPLSERARVRPRTASTDPKPPAREIPLSTEAEPVETQEASAASEDSEATLSSVVSVAADRPQELVPAVLDPTEESALPVSVR